MAMNLRMAPCCQNPENRCTGLDYGLHSRTSAFAYGASVTILGCPKKGEKGEERINTKKSFWPFSG